MPARCLSNLTDVGFIRRDNRVASTPKRSFDDRDIDDVRQTGQPDQLSDSARLIGAHRFDVAAPEQARQIGLPQWR